jgi:multiple antibiotic resistance protein
MVITWVIFLLSQRIDALLGAGGIRAVSRVFSLLLAAIGVSMMIRGLELIGVISMPV